MLDARNETRVVKTFCTSQTTLCAGRAALVRANTTVGSMNVAVFIAPDSKPGQGMFATRATADLAMDGQCTVHSDGPWFQTVVIVSFLNGKMPGVR